MFIAPCYKPRLPDPILKVWTPNYLMNKLVHLMLVSVVICQSLYQPTVDTDDTVHRGHFIFISVLINIHKPLSWNLRFKIVTVWAVFVSENYFRGQNVTHHNCCGAAIASNASSYAFDLVRQWLINFGANVPNSLIMKIQDGAGRHVELWKNVNVSRMTTGNKFEL